MPKTFYSCPLCLKQSAYVSEYGMQDSVICKCEGLNEVGRLVQGLYQPHALKSAKVKSVLSNGQPIVPPKPQNPFIGPVAQNLPQGQAQKGFTVSSIYGIQTQNFMIYELALENEVEAAGKYFNNALQSKSSRDSYMKMGNIYYAEHQDESRSLMFYVDKFTKEALNFYGRSNAHAQLSDINEIKAAMRVQGIIKN
jgi:hypothetical protein